MPPLPRLCEDASLHTLVTPVPPSRADHSFCGVLWDVHAKSEHELVVTSVHVAGMLGRVRVYARAVSWRGDEHDHAARMVYAGWGTRYECDARQWQLVADEECAPSWDNMREIRLSTPVRVLPHHSRGLFVHSSLPDDLGIRYQTYHIDRPFAEDEHLALLPGLGFTGAIPFDMRSGWFRLHRGLAGCVTYAAQPARWCAQRHATFPLAAREAVRCVLLAHRRRECLLSLLPLHLVMRILEKCHWDWFVAPGATPPLGGTALGGGEQRAHGDAEMLDDEADEDEEVDDFSDEDEWFEDEDDEDAYAW